MFYDGLSIFLGGLRETAKTLSKDSWFPGRDSNPRPPEYEVLRLSLLEDFAMIYLISPHFISVLPIRSK
jgi:hypothetical protein